MNFIIGKRDWQYILGIDDGSIVVKSDIVPDVDTVNITHLSGPLIHVAHVNPNDYNQLIISGEKKYLSLDHGLTWSTIELNEYIYSATWVNNTILVSVRNDSKENSFIGKAFMASDDFGVSWNHVAIDTDSDEPIMVAELSEDLQLSWKPIPLSSLDEKSLSEVGIFLNQQGTPILQFSEQSKYHFELNDNVLYIKEKYSDTVARPKIYQDNIKFVHGEIPAILTVSSDGLWAATQGGIFFKEHDTTLWQDKSAALGAHSFNHSFESQQGNKLLLLDLVGRLAISENKGKSWKPLANNVSKAEFLHDESIVIVQQSGRVVLMDGGDTVEISPDWKLIQSENSEAISPLYENHVYFIHGDKEGIWLTTGPVAYIRENPIEVSHYNAITQSIGGIDEVMVYHYNRHEKHWMVNSWSTESEDEYAIEGRCELSLDYDNIVSVNGYKTSDYGISEKVMLIQSGNKYAQFNDSEVQIGTLENCEPNGVKTVWDFDEIVNPAAYYETDEGLEVVALDYSSNNAVKRIAIDLNDTPPLWRWFFYFFYYQYGIYIIGVGLVAGFFIIRIKNLRA